MPIADPSFVRALVALPLLCVCSLPAQEAVWLPLGTHEVAPARREMNLAFDPDAGTVVSFSGAGGLAGPFFDDTWVFDGRHWSEVATPNRPRSRFEAAMCYDPIRRRVVLFGGRGEFLQPLFDTWTFDGSDWTRIAAGAADPDAQGSLVFDPVRGTSVLVPEGPGPVREFDGAVWSASTLPATVVEYAAAVWSDRRAAIVAAAVTSQGIELHEATALGWSPIATTTVTPPFFPLLQPRLVELPDGRILLRTQSAVGGLHSEDWIFDGTDWAQAAPLRQGVTLQVEHLVAGPGGRSLLVGSPVAGFTEQVHVRRRFEVGGGPGFQPIGPGCVGSAGRTRLAPANGTSPRLGMRFELDIAPLPTSRVSVVWLSFGLEYQVLGLGVFGLPDCALAFVPVDDVLLANRFGSARWAADIPNDAALAGAALLLQPLVLDPGTGVADVVPGQPSALFLDR